MLFWISKQIAGIFGLDISVVQKRVLLAAIVVGLVVIIASGFWLKSCFSRKPITVDPERLNKINTKTATEIKKEVQRVVEDNADVITTNDERSTIAEVNVVERNREVDDKVAVATQKIIEAKNNGQDITQEKLQCILVPADCS